MAKPIGEFNELDCLRAIVAGQLGVDSNGNVVFNYPSSGGGGSSGVVIRYPSGTLSVFSKTAGQTETIPVGAFNIGILITSGTAMIGGVSWPVNTPFNLEARTAATITVVCGSPGTAVINYLL